MQWLHIHIIPKKKKTGSQNTEWKLYFLKNIHFSYYSIFSYKEAILVQV